MLNPKKDGFDQQTACKVPVCRSKFTTNALIIEQLLYYFFGEIAYQFDTREDSIGITSTTDNEHRIWRNAFKSLRHATVETSSGNKNDI